MEVDPGEQERPEDDREERRDEPLRTVEVVQVVAVRGERDADRDVDEENELAWKEHAERVPGRSKITPPTARASEWGFVNLTSPLFGDGGHLFRPHDRVSPPLAWTAPPPGTASLALAVERALKLDAPWEDVLASEPETYWLVWGLPPFPGRLDAGASLLREGTNASGEIGYRISAPWPEHGLPLLFRLFALSHEPTLERSASRRDFNLALADLVLEQVELRVMLERRRSLFDLLRLRS